MSSDPDRSGGTGAGSSPDLRFVCPLTREPLRFVPRDALAGLVEGPGAIAGTVSGAFVSAAAGLAYPVEEGIHVFVADQALKLAEAGAAERREPEATAPTKDAVRDWYDSFGWVKGEEGTYRDSALFSFAEQNLAKRYEVLSHLSLIERLGSGRYLLDAASGAIPHPEYLAYSLFFEKRVCVDFSRRALGEAQRKLGDNGIYVLADICRLPFPDGTFDAVSSLYTVMHIPAEDQGTAVGELYRVVRPAGRVLIVNQASIEGKRKLRRWLLFPLRAALRLGRSRPAPAAENPAPAAAPGEKLYCHLNSRKWWRDCGHRLRGETDVRVFRFFTHDEVLAWFGNNPQAAGGMLCAERALGRLIAGAAHYLLVEIVKPVPGRSRGIFRSI